MFKWLKKLIGIDTHKHKQTQTLFDSYANYGDYNFVNSQPIQQEPEVLVEDERKEEKRPEVKAEKKHKPRAKRAQPAVASAKNVPAKKGGKKPEEKKPAPKKAPPAKNKPKTAGKTTK